MAEKDQLKFNVPKGIREEFARVAEDRGQGSSVAGTRLLVWFISQPDLVQAVILGSLTEKDVPDASQRLYDALVKHAGRPQSERRPEKKSV